MSGWTVAEKEQAYELMLQQQRGLLEMERDWQATLANASALLNTTLRQTVFAGFYVMKENELVLGPFQGHVSCTRIALGKGVCGESAQKAITLIIDDVTKHQNYIACDAAARSEIVVPLIVDGHVVGVIDIDSDQVAQYDEIDQKYLELYAALLVENYTS